MFVDSFVSLSRTCFKVKTSMLNCWRSSTCRDAFFSIFSFCRSMLVDSFVSFRHIFFVLSRIEQRCWEWLFIVARNFSRSIDTSTSTSHMRTTFDIFFNSRICLMKKRLSWSRYIFFFIFSTFVVVSIIFSLRIAQDDARCRARQKKSFATFQYFSRSSQYWHFLCIETWLTFQKFLVDWKNSSLRAIWQSIVDSIEYTRTRFVKWQKQSLTLTHLDVDLERRCWVNLLDFSRCDESLSNISKRSLVTLVVERTLQLDWSRAIYISNFVTIREFRSHYFRFQTSFERASKYNFRSSISFWEYFHFYRSTRTLSLDFARWSKRTR